MPFQKDIMSATCHYNISNQYSLSIRLIYRQVSVSLAGVIILANKHFQDTSWMTIDK